MTPGIKLAEQLMAADGESGGIFYYCEKEELQDWEGPLLEH